MERRGLRQEKRAEENRSEGSDRSPESFDWTLMRTGRPEDGVNTRLLTRAVVIIGNTGRTKIKAALGSSFLMGWRYIRRGHLRSALAINPAPLIRTIEGQC